MRINSKNIEVVYEGVDRSLFKPVRGDVLVNRLRQFGLSPGKYFLFVGTIQPRKNLERLIKAFGVFLSLRGAKRCGDDSELVLVGPRGWMTDEIYGLPKKLGIEGKIKFLGKMPDKDLPVLYSGAVALVFPSLFEGFGLPILEAFACSCPVITSKLSSMPEVAGDASLYVNPYNIESIAAGMEEVMDKRKKDELIKNGLKRLESFSWEKCARETLTVILNV